MCGPNSRIWFELFHLASKDWGLKISHYFVCFPLSKVKIQVENKQNITRLVLGTSDNFCYFYHCYNAYQYIISNFAVVYFVTLLMVSDICH